MPFQKGHGHFKGAEKGWFKKGQLPYNAGKSTLITKLCRGCGNEMLIFPSEIKKFSWCSKICRKEHSSLLNFKDKPCPDCGALIQRISKKCRRCANIGIPRPYIRGANNLHWKGGITPLVTQIRRSSQYKLWARQIKERDNFICQLCGVYGVGLHTDHILAFAKILEIENIKTFQDALNSKLLWNFDNGRTLCIPCHKMTPNYGKPKAVMPK